MASTNRTAGRLVQAQDAQRRAEQELHSKNLAIVNLESDLATAQDQLSRRDKEIDRLQKSLSSVAGGASSSAATSQSSTATPAERSKLRDELIKTQWLRELALLELQESEARNLVLDTSQTDSFQVFSDAFLEIGKQEGDEAATERLRHRINTLLFQLRITQSVQIKKLREQIAQMSAKLMEAQQLDSSTTPSSSAQNTPRNQQQQQQSSTKSFSTQATNTPTKSENDADHDETTTATAAGDDKKSTTTNTPAEVVFDEKELTKKVQEQTAALRKELATAEKSRLDLAGRLSDTSREMREHRQNSLTALNEAQKWETEAKKLKTQLREAQQEIKAIEEQEKQKRQDEELNINNNANNSNNNNNQSLGRDDSPREHEAMQHHRELSELQLLVDDLQSQVASSQMRLQESERKLRNERDRANMASSKCSQLEDEMAMMQGSGSAPEEKINDLQHDVERLTEKVAEQRIELSSEKQSTDRALKEKDQKITQLEKDTNNLRQQLSDASKRLEDPSPETVEQVRELRKQVNEGERTIRAEKSARERETAAATSKIAELENAIANKESIQSRSEKERDELQSRNSTLELQNESLKTQLNKAETQNNELDRKLKVTQRQADELERDLAVKVEQFALVSQQSATSNNQKDQLSKAQVKLDGARHSITMLLLSQQYLAACINLFTESVAAAVDETRFEREMKLVRDYQNKHRDQMQAQQIQHTAQIEEMKSRFARQQRLDADMMTIGGRAENNSSSSPSSSPPGSPSYGANEGTGLVFSGSSSAQNSPNKANNNNNNNNTISRNNSNIGDLDTRIALERKAFAYMSAMDVIAAHSNTVATFYLESCLLATNRENDQLHRKLREYQTERNSSLSNLESRNQILQSEKSGLQNQLNNTQARFEERVSHLTSEIKEATRREREVREKADAAESDQRRLQNKINALQQELSQLEDYAEDLKTSREMERSVLHARIQAAEESNSSNKANLDNANASASASVSDLSSALEAANLQIAREHAQVVELEGNVSELKSSMLKERRTRASLEATHREEIAVLEQRLGEIRAELAALQLQRDPMMNGGSGMFPSGEDGGLMMSGTSEFSRPQLQRELRSVNDKLSVANAENSHQLERIRELERKLANEKDHNSSSRDQIERLDNEIESIKKSNLDIKKELDETRARHATELITREGEFDKSRKKMIEQLNEMQEKQNSLKLQLHSQQMDNMSELHKVERHALDRIAAAEGEAASSNRQMFEELQDRKERVVMLEKKLSSVSSQLENRDQLLNAARDHIDTLQAEQKRKSGSDEDELSHYRQELRDLSNALVDAKRSHIAAADRSRQIMTNSEAELAELRNECTALRADIVELESRHRTDMMMKDTNHANEAKELKYAKELLDEYREKIDKMEKEHTAEEAELRKRIESLLSEVATEDVMDQLKRAQKQSEIEKEKRQEAQDYTENIRQQNNKLDAECERLRVHAKQVELENGEMIEKLKLTEATIEKKVDQTMSMMQRKVEVESQLWEAKADTVAAENSQLRRLLLEEQRTSQEAAERIAQLEIALDDLELEMIQRTMANQNNNNNNNMNSSVLSSTYNSVNRRLPTSGSPFSTSSSSPLRNNQQQQQDNSFITVTGGDENIKIPISNVRQRLLELPSLTQVIEAKQSSRLEIERLEYERRTEIEADVFEWRWAVSAFYSLLQSLFHSFSMQIMRANDHAATIESDVTQLESDVRASLVIAQRKNDNYEFELEKWKLCYDEMENRNSLIRFESFQWIESTRMLVRELANHAKLLHVSNKRVISSNAGLQQQQKDIFLFHRRQLQEFEKDNRHQISFAMGQSYGFFFRIFVFARTVMYSYEKRHRNVQRRLELMVSTERDISDVNLTILNRKQQHHQSLVLQHQQARNRQQELFGGGGNGNSNNFKENNNNNNASSFDVNLRALPEFKRADLAQTPLESVQRDELVHRRILQDLFMDWISSVSMTLSKRSTFVGFGGRK